MSYVLKKAATTATMTTTTIKPMLDTVQDTPQDFESLYRSHQDRVRAILGRLLPWDELDDAVQETFSKVYFGLDQFDHKSRLDTWIYRIAVNTAYDFNRKRLSWKKLLSSWLESQRLYQSNSKLPSLELEDALNSLAFAERTIVVLFYMQGHNQEEISEILAIPVGTVKSRLHKARQKLAKILKEEDDERS
ncbi:RNA polymerase sigma factor [Pseudobacteriovorax antillogorgiicola]|uniref:RNA polymerase sigma-70 factor, ECF subfamily n=1 Tax=Pseudobacteriovorax antillogorgiicola TaxID=1513793 RepID=A0A1Y6CN13_9BACT|nr:sigma-70 family RNA polymerase sigma factor [Pseudobacteriovorax antillogorgiicola]TCS47361.1 RNA polymerase sigma-70 factor (ECF subfamily) [Pseudobacteriovorax antillogorgiicola]SMF63336.1 RNA polymerase sigma-70 factor, ECF subfamily [Pseudobacteriovorax antillogorgiicola]